MLLESGEEAEVSAVGGGVLGASVGRNTRKEENGLRREVQLRDRGSQPDEHGEDDNPIDVEANLLAAGAKKIKKGAARARKRRQRS